MVRTDSRQDSDRPQFYSQFWIDVAMGKSSVAATAAPADVEEDEEEALPFVAPKPEVVSKAKPKVAEKKPEPGRGTITSFADLANIDELMKHSAAMDDTQMPDIIASLGDVRVKSDTDLDYDFGGEAETPAPALADQDESAFEDYDEEEDEESEDWGGSRRKKPGKAKRREHRDF